MNYPKTTITREEQRKARARLEQERHLAKVKKEKDWLAANPHIVAQQEREKEQQRLNRETLRMLTAMKEQELSQKKRKPVNTFAALMDSDSEDEDEERQLDINYKDTKWSNDIVNIYTESPYVPATVEQPKKFVWADECDD